ncbi:MAG: Transcriptional regulator AraC family [Puniceicoccaceae bacterium 5H]|nr:MAG: Transcriptional regulator AraC family [Puniceicoccaceae bacterium 5H]
MTAPAYPVPDYRSTLQEMGVEMGQVLRAADLPLALASSSPGGMTVAQVFAFWRGLAQVCADPLVGVKIALNLPREQYHPASIAAQHARTFRDGLQRLARYKSLCCAEEMRLIEQGDTCAVEIHWVGTDLPVPPRFIDAIFAAQTELGRRGTACVLHPRRVELSREPEAVEVFERFYGCRVHFRAPQNRLIFNRSDLELPFVTYNAALLEMLEPSLDRAVSDRRAKSSVSQQVKWVAQRLLSSCLPQLADVARELGMSARSLQRRIAEEGMSYRQLLTEARRELAHQYLEGGALNLVEVACLLGFEDPNSFYRAFRDWEGMTPREWQRRRSLGRGALA